MACTTGRSEADRRDKLAITAAVHRQQAIKPSSEQQQQQQQPRRRRDAYRGSVALGAALHGRTVISACRSFRVRPPDELSAL